MCQAIEKTEDGKFTYQMLPGLRVLDEVNKPGAPVFEFPEATVSVSCIRSKIIPVENDVELLQAGYGLMLADTPSRILSLSLEEGKIGHKMVSGTLSKKETKKVKKVILIMQTRLDFIKARSAAIP